MGLMGHCWLFCFTKNEACPLRGFFRPRGCCPFSVFYEGKLIRERKSGPCARKSNIPTTNVRLAQQGPSRTTNVPPAQQTSVSHNNVRLAQQTSVSRERFAYWRNLNLLARASVFCPVFFLTVRGRSHRGISTSNWSDWLDFISIEHCAFPESKPISGQKIV